MTCDKCLKRNDCPLRGMTETIEKALRPHTHIRPIQCRKRLTALSEIKHTVMMEEARN